MKPTIAVVGASADRAKFGNKCVRAYAHRGYHVYPINPNETAVEGWPAFGSVADVPVAELDRVSIYLPRAVALRVLPDIAKKAVKEVWLNPGADGPEVVAKARDLGLNVIAACSIVDVGESPASYK
ncbi:MAG: CoA-binding protein [Gemmataceae bacterium]